MLHFSIQKTCVLQERQRQEEKATDYILILQVIQNRLWLHNLPRKLASEFLCLRGSRRESKRKQKLSLLNF